MNNIETIHQFDNDLTGFENLLGRDTSRARRAKVSMFAVSVVGGLLARIYLPLVADRWLQSVTQGVALSSRPACCRQDIVRVLKLFGLKPLFLFTSLRMNGLKANPSHNVWDNGQSNSMCG